MIPVVTAEQMRALEQQTERAGISMATLMERAGEAIARAALPLGGRFWVVCGTGNNGGDGLVAARVLHRAGKRVMLTVVGDRARFSPLAREQWTRLPEEIPVVDSFDAERGDVVIDAIFGTGLTRAPAGAHADAIRAIARARARGAQVVSADLPSGLPSDSPRPFDPCVEADLSVALGAAKLGQVLEPGATQSGRLEVVDIGIVGQSDWRLALLEETDVRERIPKRAADSHKGTFGHVLVLAGGPGKTGAAAMSATAALRAGAGLVTVATRSEALPWIQMHAPELMGVPLTQSGSLGMADLEPLLEAADGKSSVVVGPGIPRGPETAQLIGELLARVDAPFVLDADALNAIGENLDVLGRARRDVVLTPHPGEMSRLIGKPTAEVQQHRIEVARELATGRKVSVVLKGARSLIAHPDGRVVINPTGNPGMATGGSGDILSGILGALLAQKLAVADAVEVGVFAHGLAGDLVSEETGEAGLIATDLLKGLCRVWTRWGR